MSVQFDLTKIKELAKAALQRCDEKIDEIQEALDYSGCTGPQFQGKMTLGRIGTTGCLLGLVAGIHVGIFASIIVTCIATWTLVQNSFIQAMLYWCTYMILLCSFHFLEFFVTAISQPSTLSNDSYIIHHSKSYTIAALASWLEFWIEYLILGKYKLFLWVWLLGVVLVLIGQIVRSAAMLHCGENFSHQIMDRKRSDHKLVTSGIYSVLRHPSYFGWFYWAIGTQLVLCNPICTVLYAGAAYMFFRDRIDYEERLLVRFYEEEYVKYCSNTYVGIPGVVSPVNAALGERKAPAAAKPSDKSQ